MRRRTPKEEVSQRSEEGRVLVALGLLAVAIPYRDKLPKDFAFPIPYPVPHLQVFTVPVFDTSVFAYSLYAACMAFYLSADAKWLSFRVRKEFQRIGHAIAVGYAFVLFWYLFTSLGWAVVPPGLGLAYGVVSNYVLFYITFSMVDILFGRWGWTTHVITSRVRFYILCTVLGQ